MADDDKGKDELFGKRAKDSLSRWLAKRKIEGIEIGGEVFLCVLVRPFGCAYLSSKRKVTNAN